MHYIVYSWCNHFTFIANALQALANNNAPLSALLIKVIKLLRKHIQHCKNTYTYSFRIYEVFSNEKRTHGNMILNEFQE